MTAERYDAFVSYGHGDADSELSAEDFDRVWAVNARGVFLGLRAVLRVMKPQRSGSIVNTASMVAIRGAATFSPYVASKHAVARLTRCAALEGAPFEIRVNTVAPGHIDTRAARALTAQIDPSDPEGVFQRIAAQVPPCPAGPTSSTARSTPDCSPCLADGLRPARSPHRESRAARVPSGRRHRRSGPSRRPARRPWRRPVRQQQTAVCRSRP
jgi:NAD(P)-dependent dehydrogenase (short-subunit alcohol dehydrogenase family)